MAQSYGICENMLDKDISDLEEEELEKNFAHLPHNMLARLKDVRSRIGECKDVIKRWQRNELVAVGDLTNVRARGPGAWQPGQSEQPTVSQRLANSRVYGFAEFQRECLGRQGHQVKHLPFETHGYDSAAALAIEMAWYYNTIVDLRKEGRRITTLPPVSIPRELLPAVGSLERAWRGVLKGWMPYFKALVHNGVKTHIIVGNRSVCPPMPPEDDRQRQLRYDAHFGPHEQQWIPQWHRDSAPHKAFVPLLYVRTLQETVDSDVWYFRTHSEADLDIAFYRIADWTQDFVQVAPGLWMLGNQLRESARTAYVAARSDWAFAIERRVAVDEITFEEMTLWDDMDYARDTVLMAGDFLRNGRGTSLEIRLSLADFQRALLDLRGWRIYCGALGQSHGLATTSGNSDADVATVLSKYHRVFLRGVFTRTHEDAARYLAYNVPVWQVMPYDKALWEELCRKESLGTTKYMRGLDYNTGGPECDVLEMTPRRERIPAVAPYRRFLYTEAQLAAKAEWEPRPQRLMPAFRMGSKNEDDFIEVGAGLHYGSDASQDEGGEREASPDARESRVGAAAAEQAASSVIVGDSMSGAQSTQDTVGDTGHTAATDAPAEAIEPGGTHEYGKVTAHTVAEAGLAVRDAPAEQSQTAGEAGRPASGRSPWSPAAAQDFRAALLCYGSSEDEEESRADAQITAEDDSETTAAGSTARSYVTNFANESLKRKAVRPGNTQPASKRKRHHKTQDARQDAGLARGDTNLHLVGEGGTRPLRWERGPAWLPAPPLRLLRALLTMDLSSSRQALATAGAQAVVPPSLFDSSTEGKSSLPPLSFFLRAFIGDEAHGRTTPEMVMRGLHRWIMMRHYLLRKIVVESGEHLTLLTRKVWLRVLKDKDGYSDWADIVKALGLEAFDYHEPERDGGDGSGADCMPEETACAHSSSVLTQFTRLSGFMASSTTPNFNGIALEPYTEDCASWLSDDWRSYILYELGEMEFRHKLFELDHLIRLCHPQNPAWRDESVVKRFNRVAACWGGGGLTVGVDEENWLVCEDMTKRSTALTHFADLVRQWPGADGVPDEESVARAREDSESGGEKGDFIDVEDRTWKAYMQAFWDYTRGKPVLPLQRPVFPGSV
ncbi:hypothetical protein AURDEDRAFT_176642 [Auricularia subglabra TFB-10046 SS5]|uniref:Uncharacterized protein n=1 Tax=Auricularia subglabra (strain TFB-10046 / SS5) TaxID=717982 RepID=J0WPG8_AURST|nr:hypothetical protein AURDEDRAFT_176642 [Auricularia subglabra TFB-10046 SS5]